MLCLHNHLEFLAEALLLLCSLLVHETTCVCDLPLLVHVLVVYHVAQFLFVLLQHLPNRHQVGRLLCRITGSSDKSDSLLLRGAGARASDQQLAKKVVFGLDSELGGAEHRVVRSRTTLQFAHDDVCAIPGDTLGPALVRLVFFDKIASVETALAWLWVQKVHAADGLIEVHFDVSCEQGVRLRLHLFQIWVRIKLTLLAQVRKVPVGPGRPVRIAIPVVLVLKILAMVRFVRGYLECRDDLVGDLLLHVLVFDQFLDGRQRLVDLIWWKARHEASCCIHDFD